MKYLFKQATIINEGKSIVGDVLIHNQRIEKIASTISNESAQEIDCEGKYLIPGMIDGHVHFREPGLMHKSDMHSGSIAALAGGITSVMEMPNTIPNVLTREILEDKFNLAATKCLVNYSFYMGSSNDNLEEVLRVDSKKVCGVKVFMGSSTGNMLVDNHKTLENIFSKVPYLIATHCEDETTIRHNMEMYREKFGENVPVKYHPIIRSEEACFMSSEYAVSLAKRCNTRLHILHLSTGKEVSLFDRDKSIEEKRITGEVCVHHLWYSDEDYDKMGVFIKWNPAIKTEKDRSELWEGLKNGAVDVIGTDHAPHLISEKEQTYFKSSSGGPLTQQALLALLEKTREGIITKEQVIEKFAHNPARVYQVENRGFIREGYFADLVVVNPNDKITVSKDNLLYKCGWSPFEGVTFHHVVEKTFVNGNLVYNNGKVDSTSNGQRLSFDR